MHIAPSANLIAALSTAGAGPRPVQANATAGGVGPTAGITPSQSRPVAPQPIAPQQTAPAAPSGRGSPLGRLIDIRV